MAKQLTIGEKIRRYMEVHPDAPPKKIAQDLNVKVGYVHNLRSLDKKSLAEGKPIRRIKRTYVKKPKKMIITAKEAAVAQRLGIDLKTYAEGKAEFMKLKRKAKLTSESFPKVGDSVGGLTLTRRALPDNTYMYR